MNESKKSEVKSTEEWASLVIQSHKSAAHRYLLGIVGAPAAGKSTFAANLVNAINQKAQREIAIVVPMDGFHYSNEELEREKLLHLKGIPATFDAAGYVNLIEQIKSVTSETVFCPLFDRSIEASIEGGIEVKPQHQIIISEGNYLLLTDHPWSELKQSFDEIWFIEAAIETLMPRLIERHMAGGKNEVQAREKICSTDLPNAELITATRSRADKVIKLY